MLFSSSGADLLRYTQYDLYGEGFKATTSLIDHTACNALKLRQPLHCQ